MSKILKSFGMAALLVALLAGTGAANPIEVTGCYFPSDYLELDATGLTDPMDLGVLPTIAAIAGGSVDVRSGALWNLEVIDTDDDGLMKDASQTPTAELTDKFQVLGTPLVGGGSAVKTVVKNDGIANVDCDPVNVPITYTQTIDGDDAGDYSIELTFSLAVRS